MPPPPFDFPVAFAGGPLRELDGGDALPDDRGGGADLVGGASRTGGAARVGADRCTGGDRTGAERTGGSLVGGNTRAGGAVRAGDVRTGLDGITTPRGISVRCTSTDRSRTGPDCSVR